MPNVNDHPRVELPERLARDVDPGDHAVRLRQNHPASPLIGLNGPVRRDIAATDVLGQRATHQVSVRLR
jgi:hypothetical protein